MSKNIVGDFIYSIKRALIYRQLKFWKRNNTKVHTSSLKRINPEYREDAKNMFIRRTFEGSDIFVDLYWHIKRSEHKHHEDYIYYRCNWTKAKRTIEKVEADELPKRINLMLGKSAES